MQSRFLAAVSATILTFAASAMTAQAQTPDASKKKIENITNYGAVQTSTGPAKGYTGPYTANPPKRKTDLQIAPPPSPATPKNPNGGWRGPTNPNPVRVTTSTTTYHAASTPARTVTTTPVRTVTTTPARTVTTTPAKKP